jgi:hypothetical protein
MNNQMKELRRRIAALENNLRFIRNNDVVDISYGGVTDTLHNWVSENNIASELRKRIREVLPHIRQIEVKSRGLKVFVKMSLGQELLLLKGRAFLKGKNAYIKFEVPGVILYQTPLMYEIEFFDDRSIQNLIAHVRSEMG